MPLWRKCAKIKQHGGQRQQQQQQQQQQQERRQQTTTTNRVESEKLPVAPRECSPSPIYVCMHVCVCKCVCVPVRLGLMSKSILGKTRSA